MIQGACLYLQHMWIRQGKMRVTALPVPTREMIPELEPHEFVVIEESGGIICREQWEHDEVDK